MVPKASHPKCIGAVLTGGIVGADMLLYGLILMLVIAFEPRGLVAIFGRIAASLSRSKTRPSLEKNDGAA